MSARERSKLRESLNQASMAGLTPGDLIDIPLYPESEHKPSLWRISWSKRRTL